jgi:hypothetical protein
MSASVLDEFAAGELFDRLDGLLRIGHCVQLVLDSVSRALECVVVQEHANGVASRVGGEAIRHELNSGACGNDAFGVVELICALGDDEERQAECECPKC